MPRRILMKRQDIRAALVSHSTRLSAAAASTDTCVPAPGFHVVALQSSYYHCLPDCILGLPHISGCQGLPASWWRRRLTVPWAPLLKRVIKAHLKTNAKTSKNQTVLRAFSTSQAISFFSFICFLYHTILELLRSGCSSSCWTRFGILCSSYLKSE